MKDNKRKVSLISRESDNEPLDFKLLRTELESRDIEVEVLTKRFVKKLSLASIAYLVHIVKQINSIKSSKVVVLDTYCIPACMMSHSNTEVIQMWHALSAIKKFGWQTIGKEDGSSERIARMMKMHNGYDHILCSSDITAEYFCEAFKASKDKIVKMGMPRIDYILSDNPDAVDAIKQRYSELLENKKTILYAPTFHKGRPVDVKGLVDAIDLDKYNIIVKLHPLDRDSSEKVVKRGIIYDNHFDTYDLLRTADIVISDYSSFAVEASLTCKPLYLYVYDENTYEMTTGLNMHFDEEAIGKYTFHNADELAASINEEYDVAAIRAFRDKYIDVNTENCTGQLANYIELLLDK